ncbi:MAG: hypothetical protein L6264_07025 [Weeksellaceae bacterium]|nr:hypothetical protein [Bacteroidota bacterium]MCG2780684.1 hypothetical protein [Weeksellaceae bacterium]OWK73359.1 hypothetical protein CBW16_11490 [Flavobacteriaceae bacterium JJC]
MKIIIFLLFLTINLYAQSSTTIKNIADFTTGEEFLSLINKKIIVASLRNVNFLDVNVQTTKKHKTDYRIFEPGEFRPLTIGEYNSILANSLLLIDRVKFVEGQKEITLSEFNAKISAGSQTYPSVKLYAKKNDQHFEFFNTYGGLNFANLIQFDLLEYHKLKTIGRKFLKKAHFKIDNRLNIYSAIPAMYTNNDVIVATDVRVSHSDPMSEKVDGIFVYIKTQLGDYSMIPIIGSHNTKTFDETYVELSEYDDYVVKYNTEVPKMKSLHLENTKKQQEERENYYKEYVKLIYKKYGNINGNRVLRGELVPGMTKEMMLDAFEDNEMDNHTVSLIGRDKWESYMFKSGNKYVLISLRNEVIYSITK